MVRANLKGVFATYKHRRDGSRATYWYHRATGMRLHGIPGSPQFLSDFAAAESLCTQREHGTFSGLVRDYTMSEEFQKLLAPSSREQYRRMLTKAELEFGTLPVDALNDPRIRRNF